MKPSPTPCLSPATSFPRGRESSLLWAPTCALATVILAAGLLLAQAALAGHPHTAQATAPTPAALRATLAGMPRGDARRGQALSQRLMCASCHGDRGTAPTGNWTSLAGQRAAYTYKSLLDYRDGGRREHGRAALMAAAVDGMSRQDMADVAAWYASQPATASPAPAISPAARRQAANLARRGDPSRLITPCASCHGARGQGGINATPALAGQTVGGFTRTMLDYREGRRTTDAHQGMGQFARRLSLEEINALAAYYAAPGPR